MPPAYPRLHHEGLDAYQAAVAFLALATNLLAEPHRGYSSMAEQFRTASLSIPLHIAEGYGKRSPQDRARSYDIARGSAHECAAILDALQVLRFIKEGPFVEGKTLLHRIVSMLVKMVDDA